MRRPDDPNSVPPGNIITAVVFSLVILTGFYFLFEKPRMEAARAKYAAEQEMKAAAAKSDPAQIAKKAAEEAAAEAARIKTRDEVMAQEIAPRLSFETEHLKGSISLKGARLDDLMLLGHYKTVAKKNLASLFAPEGAEHSYFAQFGWVSHEAVSLPDEQTVWRLEENTAVKNDPAVARRIVLSWDNGAGLLFRKTVTIDHDYMFHITQMVQNYGEEQVSLYPYGALTRAGKPVDYMGFFILHEGPLQWLDGDFESPDYDSVELGKAETHERVKGWIGFTDKYWFAGLIPGDMESMNTVRYVRSGTEKAEEYQTDITAAERRVAPGATVSHEMRLYAGVKHQAALRKYEAELGIKNLELAIDFGIFWFLTKPLFMLLTWLGNSFGIGIGILVLTVILKLLTFPLTSRAFTSMTKTAILAPQMKELKEKYAHDREKLQTAFLELYQKEGVNPLSGCWPMMVQIPIFFSLYKVILTNVMLRHEPFWGWISDLSAPDPTSVFNLFGLIPFDPPQILMIGAWPCLMGFTMFWLNQMSPKPTDPTQKLLKSYFPYLFTIMLAHFASGLVIYWAWSNVLTVMQQYVILRRLNVPISLIRGRLDDPQEDAQKELERRRAEDEPAENAEEETSSSGKKAKKSAKSKKKK
ncbi:MAG: membrane protein insertase YidC [Alphaproteobacteria bacterium]|nr:MAG: membrane protein insertase YidC [Alphaproteobacteria bacterium]